MIHTTNSDVLIIGAGLSGLCLAHQLAAQGISCNIVDKKQDYPESFRADKLEYNQIDQLRKMHLDQFVIPQMKPIGNIQSYCDGQLETIDTIDQYGFDYTKTVNNLRANLPSGVALKLGTVTNITTGASHQTISLKDNQQLTAKVVVIATGGNESVTKLVGIQRNLIPSLTSLNFGFDVKRKDGTPFDFRGFNYYAEQLTNGVDYITFFLIGDNMRVNIFSQWDAKDPRAKALRADPLAEMPKHFKELYRFVGELELASKVQVFPTHFYRTSGHVQNGLVVIADEFQSVSPATGKGLDKLTNDVTLLSEKYIPAWLSNGRASKRDIAQFYNDKSKKAVDLKGISDWMYYRRLSTGKKPSILQRIIFRLKACFNTF
ncbi:FAD-dependent oxidoreductase [Saccharophagus degradans]|uniref:NAD(P)/FAD-dependent oxidoreductase n=1 Tax=Saccharophagus degradans TaxID=86304 RepID=A0AAW7XAE3_9GAMM|nr:NAD(P)/FAD-dependent oxidoreductase [Saccharophagus degradans]MDO6424860.1 NAD(P)/FAD-dependent oxidoreductase [Saccharophagus degradans]MDO6606648.1 NAD(P)/FAD-dependent oxidoreductase [Saccharophagus degradans]